MRCLTLVLSVVLIAFQGCAGGPPLPEKKRVGLEYPQSVRALGETKARLDMAYERLCSPPLGDLDFVLADVELDMTRRFTNYSGDISGRMLGALQIAGPILGRTSPMVEQLAAAFPGLQKADGHYGCEQDLDNLVQTRDMPILWGNGRLLLAVAERLREKEDPKLLAAARKLGDYVISTRKYYGKRENFEKVGGHYASGFTTCYPSLVDGMAALGEITGDPRFSDEARFIARLSLIDESFEKRHSHGRLSAFRGMLDLDRNLPNPEFVPTVAEKVRMVTDKLILPTGGVTERFDREDPRDEGCTEGDWIRVNVFLWEATGDTRFLDTAEHAVRNHLAGTQQHNGGFGHYYWGKLKHGGKEYDGARIRGSGSEAYWCCSMHGTQILADVARWSVLSSGGDIIVTWLGEAKSELKLGDRSVTVTAKREGPAAWNLSFDSADGDRVWLRVPGWAGAITVDGQEREVKNGWAEMFADGAASWKVEFPDKIQIRGPYGDEVLPEQPVRVFAAGELYCLPESELTSGLIGSDDVPQVVMDAERPDDRKIHVVIVTEDQRTQRATLVPVATRPWGGSRLLLGVRRVDTREFRQRHEFAMRPGDHGVPVEVKIGCDGVIEAYLNGRLVSRTNGWVETPSVQTFSDREENVLALKVISKKDRPGLMAMVRAGGRLHVTGNGTWTAVPCDEKVPADWLTDPKKGAEKAAKIADLGGFGVDPWKHMSAGYAGSGTRWVWPEPDGKPGKRWWLLRYEFRIPQEQGSAPRRAMKYARGEAEDATKWQKELRAELFRLLKLDDLAGKKTPLDAKTTINAPDKTRQYYEAEINSTPTRRIRVIVSVPRYGAPHPAVVCIHGHGGNRRVVYQEGNIYKGFAKRLALNRVVTVSVDVGQHKVCEEGRTLMGERLWDLMRCVDYLETIPEVDRKRIGCAGLSLGGEMAMWLGAMDARISAVLSSGFLTTMDQMEQKHCMCWKFPGLRELVDYADIYALTAPRPLMCQNGLKEPQASFFVPLARLALSEIRHAYCDLGKPDNVELAVHEGGHEIDMPSLQEFFTKHFGVKWLQ